MMKRILVLMLIFVLSMSCAVWADNEENGADAHSQSMYTEEDNKPSADAEEFDMSGEEDITMEGSTEDNIAEDMDYESDTVTDPVDEDIEGAPDANDPEASDEVYEDAEDASATGADSFPFILAGAGCGIIILLLIVLRIVRKAASRRRNAYKGKH